jgi:hypothetical protein
MTATKTEYATKIDSAAGFEEFLQHVLGEIADTAGYADPAELPDRGQELAHAQIDRFGDTGLMTRDKGLRIRLDNGAEFQVTIKQSERANEDADVEVRCEDCDEPLDLDDAADPDEPGWVKCPNCEYSAERSYYEDRGHLN